MIDGLEKPDLDFSIDDSRVVLAWGVTVALGWLFTSYGEYVVLERGKVLAGWAVLMLVPVVMTAVKELKGSSNRILNTWALLIFALLVENFLAPLAFLFFSYYPLWLIGGAALFYYTSERIPPPSKKTYRYAAVLNLAVIPVVYFIPQVFIGLVAAVVQASPILYDWFKVHR